MNERKIADSVLLLALLLPAPRGLPAPLVSKLESGHYSVTEGRLPLAASLCPPTAQVAWATVGNAAAKFGGATLTATFRNFSCNKIASVHDTGSASLSCASIPSTMSNAGEVRALFSEVSTGGACARQSRFGDLEGTLHWEWNTVELTAQTGYRFGDSYDVTADSRRWSSATATIWLNDRIAFVGGGGRQPALPVRGLPS